MDKTCPRCKLTKTTDDFFKNLKNSDGLQSHCKQCQKEKKAKHYQENKAKYFEKNDAWKTQRQQSISEIKVQNGCCLCPEREACCLEFHHTDSSLKEFSLARATSKSWKRVIEEIAKCVVICRNCHAKVHNGLLVVPVGTTVKVEINAAVM